jgi:hypothetical protein
MSNGYAAGGDQGRARSATPPARRLRTIAVRTPGWSNEDSCDSPTADAAGVTATSGRIMAATLAAFDRPPGGLREAANGDGRPPIATSGTALAIATLKV